MLLRSESKLKFVGIHFRTGMLVVDAVDKHSAEWLVDKAPQLVKWSGKELRACVGDIPKLHVVDIFFPRSKEMEEEWGAQHHQYFYKDPLVVRTNPPLYYIFYRVSKIDIILSLVLINSRYIPKFTHNSHIFHGFNNSRIIPGFPSCWQSYKKTTGVSSLKNILLDDK